VRRDLGLEDDWPRLDPADCDRSIHIACIIDVNTCDMRRESIHVRNAADLRRVSWRLFARWRPPRITVDTGHFPLLFAQRAQDRFAHLADACNCLFGEVLGGMMLLGGFTRVWIFSRSWADVGLVLLAALGLLLVGKAIEVLWTRLRMLWLLFGLRRRLGSSKDLPATKPVGDAWLEAGDSIQPRASLAAAAERPVARASRRKPRRRPRFVLGTAADITRLGLRVATRWTLPRAEIRIVGIPEQAAQRAQHRYVRLADSGSYMLAGVLTTLTLLIGMLYVLWKQIPDSDPLESLDPWRKTLGWSNVEPVVIAALCAGLFGWAVERLVIRVRLLWVLCRLRRNVNMVSFKVSSP